MALPTPCRHRERVKRVRLQTVPSFAAVPGTLNALLIADSPPNGQGPPTAAGLLRLGGAQPLVQPLPWPTPEPPLVTPSATPDQWLVAHSRALGENRSEVLLWRGGKTERVAVGEDFRAIDLRCEKGVCALLTTRLGNISRPGAHVWLGREQQPLAQWHPRLLAAPAGEVWAPYAIAGLRPSKTDDPAAVAPGAVVTLSSERDLLFFYVDARNPPRRLAQLPADHGVLDVTADPVPRVLGRGATPDQWGCSPLGGGVIIESEGASTPRVTLPTTEPALQGSLLGLAGGLVASFIAPLKCRTERAILYMALLAPKQLEPDSSANDSPVKLTPHAIGDADSYAAASSGAELDIWLLKGATVTWVRAECSFGR